MGGEGLGLVLRGGKLIAGGSDLDWGGVEYAEDGCDQPLEEEDDADLFEEEVGCLDYDYDDLDFFFIAEIEKERVLLFLQRYGLCHW